MDALKRLSAALAIAAAPLATSAHETGLSTFYEACMGKSGATTMDMIGCITAENQRQDTGLNKAYKVLMAQLPPPRKAQLQGAQRAWIKYRDANCAFYDDPDGGTLARVNANTCVMTATAERARELERLRQ